MSAPIRIPQTQTKSKAPRPIQRTPKLFTPSTQLPALATVKRNGKSYLANVDKTKDFNGHLFARVTFGDGFRTWTNAVNIVEVV